MGPFDFGFFRGSGWFADVYDQTVVMSPYLVAFVVSDFINKTYTTPNGTKVAFFINCLYFCSKRFLIKIKLYVFELAKLSYILKSRAVDTKLMIQVYNIKV